MHALEFLADKTPFPNVPIVAMYGAERYFRPEVLRRIPGASGADAELSLTRITGEAAELKSVMIDLRTVSMFGDKRVLLIEDADPFVSENRAALEKYVAAPAKGSLLILDVRAWKKTERLYKLVEQHGLNIECGELKGAELIRWMQQIAKQEYGKTLDRDNAALITALAGDGLSMLRQEIAKLAALAGDAAVISREDVIAAVGGWRTETTWVMLDALRDGRPGKALENLQKLFRAGESPAKILGGVVFSFRKFAEATELARQGEKLSVALERAGVFSNAIGPSEQYLKRLGFERASRMLSLLMEADSEIKGGSRTDPQLLLERLFVRLAGEVVVTDR
jgi:DNA polymerase-3 subunit delta